MSSLPKLRSDLVTSRQESQDVTYVVIKDPRTARYFRLREPEFWLINQFDGASTPENIALAFERKFSSRLPEGAVEAFARKLDSLSFLETDRAEYESSRVIHKTELARNSSLVTRALFVKLSVFDPTRFLDMILRLYRPLHGRAIFLSSGLFLLMGLGVLWANVPSFNFSFVDVFSFGSLVAVVVSLALIIFFHELAHAVTCRIHGGQVTEVGFLLLYLQPCFFANLSDAWMFEKKSNRLAVLWAGPYMQLLTLAAAVFLWRVTIQTSAINQIALITAVVSMVTVLFNFNPLIKLDGYYLLSDWLEIPNLRAKAFKFFRLRLKYIFLGITPESEKRQTITPRESRIYIWYAILASLYSAALLAYIYSLLWGWLVPRYGLWAGVALSGLPVYIMRSEFWAVVKYLTHPVDAMKKIFSSPLRIAVYTVTLSLGALILFGARFTDRVSGPVEVRALHKFSISGGPGGQIKTEYRIGGPRPDVITGYLSMSSLDLSALDIRRRVSVGDRVLKGDTLLALRSNQVTAELESARSALATLEARLALLKSPPKAESLLVLQADARALESEFRRAKSELKRKRELYSKNLIAKNELEDSEAGMDVSRSRWESSQAQVLLFRSPPKPEEEAVILNDLKKQTAAISFLESQEAAQVIVSPFHGRIVAGTGPDDLVVVIDDSQVEAVVQVSDYDIQKVSSGNLSKLKVRSFPRLTFEGFVSRISEAGVVEMESGRFEVATLYENPNGYLKPGMSGYAKINVGQKSLFSIILNRLGSLIRVEFWSLW